MEDKIKSFICFLNDIERLKSTTRHSWTSTGRHESVPEHSWRMAVMAMIVKDEFPKVDIAKVIEICLIHDFGEVYDGDVPGFEKKEGYEKKEEIAVKKVVKPLANKTQNKIVNLWKEFEDCKTPEAQLAKALDKLEVLIQHNEADISTWLSLEYDLNLTYGQEFCQYNDFIKLFRKIVDEMTKEKISKGL
jgi:putative hydrolase of HD superfamily